MQFVGQWTHSTTMNAFSTINLSLFLSFSLSFFLQLNESMNFEAVIVSVICFFFSSLLFYKLIHHTYLHTTYTKKLKRHPFLYLNVHLGTHQEWVNRKIIRLDHERKVYGTILICIILSFELDLLSLKLNWMYVNNMIKTLATNAALLLVCVSLFSFLVWYDMRVNFLIT